MGVIIIFTIILIMSYQFKANAISISSVGVIIIEIGVIICSIICALASGYIINKKEVKPEKALLYILPLTCSPYYFASFASFLFASRRFGE